MTENLATSKPNRPTRPEGSKWGRFRCGRQPWKSESAHPEEIRQGAAFAPSLTLNLGGNGLNANRLPPAIRSNLLQRRANSKRSLGPLNDTSAVLNLQYSTPPDSLAHAGYLSDAEGDGTAEVVYYNRLRAGIEVTFSATPVRYDLVPPGIDADRGTSSSGCSQRRSASTLPKQPPTSNQHPSAETVKDLS